VRLRYKLALASSQVLALCLAFGCGPRHGRPAARVGPNVITEETIAEQLEQIPPYARMSFEGPDGESKLLEKLIEQELLYLEALDLGFDRDPEVRKKLEQARRRVLVGECYAREIHTRAGIPDDQVRRYYREHRDDYLVPSELEFHQVVVETEQAASEITDRLRAGEAFADVAREMSVDRESGEKGGVVGLYEKGRDLGLPEAVAAELDTLRPGQVSDPIEAEGRYYVIMLKPVGPPEYKTLEEAAPLIRDRLLVSDEDVAAYYADNMDEYYLPEQVNLRHVVVASEREAERLRRQVLQGKPIEDVAKEHSTDAQSARRGGQVRSYRRGGSVPGLGVSPEFEEAAFSTAAGEVSPVFHTTQGYHFLQVESRREGRQQTLEEVEGRIRPSLVVEARTRAREDYYNKLRQKYGVEILLSATVKSAEELFQEAREAQNPREKIEIYEQILGRFPESARAEDSQFMIGFLQAEELGDPEAAIATLEMLLQRYPKSHWCDDAQAMIQSLRTP
jgi:peptidyl-prolyl cis-trans isomerase C